MENFLQPLHRKREDHIFNLVKKLNALLNRCPPYFNTQLFYFSQEA